VSGAPAVMMEPVTSSTSASRVVRLASGADPRSAPRMRMSAVERRAQLIDVARGLFAERGYDGTSVEEVAARAGVSKPVVYEHFGGKEGLYAVVVDREMTRLLAGVTEALQSEGHPRTVLERAALALLDYVETSTDGFRILVRDSPVAQSTGLSPACCPTPPGRWSTSSPSSSRLGASTRPSRPCTPRCSSAWSP